MIENFAFRLARVLTEYSVPVQRGDLVVINAPIEAMPLIEALYESVLERGGHFAPMEVLDLMAREIRAFFRPLRNLPASA